MSANSNRIIQLFVFKKEHVLVQADSFLACAAPLENLQSGPEMKKKVKEGKKKQFSA